MKNKYVLLGERKRELATIYADWCVREEDRWEFMVNGKVVCTYCAEDVYSVLIYKTDIVDVVRCKDCKHRNTDSCAMWIECSCCGSQADWCLDDDYCSWGERREG